MLVCKLVRSDDKFTQLIQMINCMSPSGEGLIKVFGATLLISYNSFLSSVSTVKTACYWLMAQISVSKVPTVEPDVKS